MYQPSRESQDLYSGYKEVKLLEKGEEGAAALLCPLLPFDLISFPIGK
jgi:hypothetical protein